jgi:dihydropyrimidinase
MSLLIQSGTLITAAETFTADILIEGEKIAAIGEDLHIPDAQVVAAQGKLVLPGGVDPHVHLDLPMFGTVSADDHYTGSKAAAFGGVTTMIDFAPLPPISAGERGGARAAIEAWRSKADPKVAVDYGLHLNVSRLDEQIAAELPRLPELGVTSLKVFMAYNGRLRLSDGGIFRLMRIAKEHGLLTMLHAENGDVIEILSAEALEAGHTSAEWHALTRPAWGAVEAALRGAALAAQAGAPLYLVHVNTAGEVDMIHYARERNLPLMGETCPAYLFFTIDFLRRPDGAKWVCSPPIRNPEDNNALWKALANGTIQTLGTDHCPFFFDGTKAILYEGQAVAIPGKELGREDFTKIPNGLPGVGDRLPILWTYGVRAGRITPNQFVTLVSTNPAKIFGLYPRKGALLPGSDADIVIWDADRRLTYGIAHAHHRTDYNLFEHWEVVGFPEKVFLRGRLIVDGERWLGRPGMGQYLPRQTGIVL